MHRVVKDFQSKEKKLNIDDALFRDVSLTYDIILIS